MSDTTSAYKSLIEILAKQQYTFICPTPETQARVVNKRQSEVLTKNAKTAQDFFGWSLPCSRYYIANLLHNHISKLITWIDRTCKT